MKMVSVIWDNCRRPDGTYDLSKAARHTGCKITEPMDMFLSLVESIGPITSRQASAIAIATALALYEQR